MPLALRFGPYSTPRFRYGSRGACLRRGEVTIRQLSAAPIPWPMGNTEAEPALGQVLYADLARAVRLEQNAAVAHAWGVTGQTVTKWRRALGVRGTLGDSMRRVEHGKSARGRVAIKAMRAKAREPARRAKIAAAKRGKPRPPDTVRAIRAAKLGTKTSKATRAKMSAAHKRHGTRPPAAGIPWTAAEDELVRTLASAEVAERTGRTLTAVLSRRWILGLPDRRRKVQRRVAGG